MCEPIGIISSNSWKFSLKFLSLSFPKKRRPLHQTLKVKTILRNDKNSPPMAMAENGKPEFEEKLVEHMGYEGHEKLSTLLRPHCSANYRLLADKLGCSYQVILDLQEERDPVHTLFGKYPDLTFSKLKSCLEKMERNDVLEELEPFEADTLTPSEHNKKYKERNRLAIVDESKNLTVLSDDIKYDAFICYAKEDLEFAKKILKKLESAPYHLKLCIYYRDILPGADNISTIVNVIEDRCRKVVVIISRYFREDEIADFQAKIALRLSPGCRERRVIPILLDERSYVPRILGHITHLDYNNMPAREFFWTNLAKSLGYTG